MSVREALVAIDLGAESCRVSLLQWRGDAPEVRMVHRFANAAAEISRGLRWDLDRICRELEHALHRCAEFATEGIAAIG
ncbi:MAG: carbohydrate kinase, partial [Acidobacteriaceae bacterium]